MCCSLPTTISQNVKELARENGVMLVENVVLARALAKEVESGHPVPTKWYQAVAVHIRPSAVLRAGAPAPTRPRGLASPA
ncbi:MAG: EscU/YscU/HrcU family type III secretion system export apparatus switch protein [Kiritimatiellia bacterium]|nr:EscU/YscU/HrcU family type III secretion system export apparatus switch protein [Kiritimatiellia bacterium]